MEQSRINLSGDTTGAFGDDSGDSLNLFWLHVVVLILQVVH